MSLYIKGEIISGKHCKHHLRSAKRVNCDINEGEAKFVGVFFFLR